MITTAFSLGEGHSSGLLHEEERSTVSNRKVSLIAMAKTSENSHGVRLQLTCLKPPHHLFDATDVEFGLQDRHQGIFAGRLQADGSLRYEIEVSVVPQSETHEVRWRGFYVHGTPTAPFLYLSLKRLSSGSWIKRLKVPLPRLAWEQIEAIHTTPCLVASISGERSGTVPLLGDGWTPQDRSQVEP
jgi:hypothetical protein